MKTHSTWKKKPSHSCLWISDIIAFEKTNHGNIYLTARRARQHKKMIIDVRCFSKSETSTTPSHFMKVRTIFNIVLKSFDRHTFMTVEKSSDQAKTCIKNKNRVQTTNTNFVWEQVLKLSYQGLRSNGYLTPLISIANLKLQILNSSMMLLNKRQNNNSYKFVSKQKKINFLIIIFQKQIGLY